MTASVQPILSTPVAPAALRADTALVSGLRASPNHGERRGAYGFGKKLDLVILHYTGMPEGRGMSGAERAITWLTSEESQVSCHYVVDEAGQVTQLVSESRRAWHAGVSAWHGETDINSASIGIEIVNPGHPWDMSSAPFLAPGEPAQVHPGYRNFPEGQIAAVIALVRDIMGRNAISSANVLAHSDIAPGRKSDPGEKFPWDKLAAAGIGAWVEPEPLGDADGLKFGNEGQPVRALQSMLAVLGYDLAVSGAFDRSTSAVITAFQRHWRPARVDGIADRSTVLTLNRLLQSRDTGEVSR